MKIIKVLSSQSAGDDLTTFRSLMATDIKDTKGQTVLSKDDIDNIKKYNGYIVVVLRNRVGQREDMLDKQFRLEENLASNYMGQHWYRSYVAPFYGETPEIFPNGQYFGALSTNVKDLPFANFYPTYKSNISKMISSFVQRQRNDYRQYGTLRFTQSFAKNVSKKLVRSIVYFNRNTSDAWSPLKNPETQLSALLKEFDHYMFQRREVKDFTPETIRSLAYEGGTKLVEPEFYPNLELYIFYPAPKSGFKVDIKFTDNPNKENLQHTEGVEPFALATAGLLSNRCAQYQINGTSIFTPAAGSVRLGGQNDKFKWLQRQPVARDFESPSYKVYVTASAKNRGVIPKTEVTIIEEANTSNALRVEYQTKEITRDAIQIMNRLTEDCSLSPEAIQEIHDKLAANLNYSVSSPFNSLSYRVMGVTLPAKIQIREGLESLKVRIGDDGVYTDIAIGDSLFTPPSPDLILRALELHRSVELANFRTNPL